MATADQVWDALTKAANAGSSAPISRGDVVAAVLAAQQVAAEDPWQEAGPGRWTRVGDDGRRWYLLVTGKGMAELHVTAGAAWVHTYAPSDSAEPCAGPLAGMTCTGTTPVEVPTDDAAAWALLKAAA